MSPGRTALGSAVSIMTVPLLRPMATAAIAGRSVATRTMRGLRGLTEKQLAVVPYVVGCRPARPRPPPLRPPNAAVRDPRRCRMATGLCPVSSRARSATSGTGRGWFPARAVARGHDAYASAPTTRPASAKCSLRRAAEWDREGRILDENIGTRARRCSNKPSPRSPVYWKKHPTARNVKLVPDPT